MQEQQQAIAGLASGVEGVDGAVEWLSPMELERVAVLIRLPPSTVLQKLRNEFDFRGFGLTMT